MDLSLVLCTWNNAERLRITLDAIAQCEVPEGLRWEVVLVNNNCTDHTDAVAEEFTGRLPLRYVHEATPGLSHARNAGIKAAQGELIIFTDDDVKPCKNWIAIYWLAYCKEPQGRYFGGPIESEYEADPPHPALLSIAQPSVVGLNWGTSEHALTKGEFFVSANWACPRGVLEAMGGFNPELGLNAASNEVRVGEESDLMARLRTEGWVPWYLPEAQLKHFVPASKTTLEHIASRFEASGFADALSRKVGERARHPYLRVIWPALQRLAEAGWDIAKLRLQAKSTDRRYVTWRYRKGFLKGVYKNVRCR